MITKIEATGGFVITTTTTEGGELLGLNFLHRKEAQEMWEWHEAVASHIADHHASMMGKIHPCPTVPPKPDWMPSNEEIDAIEAMPNLLPEEFASTQPQAYISEADTVWCNECWEVIQEENIGDQDPNARLFAKQPWHPNHVCQGCDCKDGRSLLHS
jgi:hypothetical protein